MSEKTIYENRQEAGIILASHLSPFVNHSTVILSLPRGGTIVAAEIAQIYHLTHDLIIVRKIGAPFDPEIAIGAVTLDGQFISNETYIEALAIPEEYIEVQTERELQEIRRRLALFKHNTDFPNLVSNTVIVVDDGIATGYTMEAALRWIQTFHPQQICLAVPVGSREALKRLRPLVDHLICPYVPERFSAVGNYYLDFEQVSDKDVQTAISPINSIN